MTGDTHAGARIQGSLRSADGKGIVRMEGRFDTGIDDLWSALTDRDRLASWLGVFDGDLRLGGGCRWHFYASGADGAGRVETCEPRQRLVVVVTKGVDEDEPDEQVWELALAADGDQAVLVIEQDGVPLEWIGAFGAASRSMSKISPPTSRGVGAATPMHAWTSSCLPTTNCGPPRASTGPRWIDSYLVSGNSRLVSILRNEPGACCFQGLTGMAGPAPDCWVSSRVNSLRSATNRSGCSMAAKSPPRSNSRQWTTCGNCRSAKRRTGLARSPGKPPRPPGTAGAAGQVAWRQSEGCRQSRSSTRPVTRPLRRAGKS